MLVVKHPSTSDAEDKKLKSILKADVFKPHAVTWQQAYDDYRAANGDPWSVTAATFSPSIRKDQLELYKNRRNGGPLRRIRQMVGLKHCPICGSPSIGTLDHYLPKEDFPEFSILPSNLLPACSLCNSGAKGRTFKGGAAGERFLHPYYDKLGDEAVWRVEIDPPYAAATFRAVPEPNLSPGDTTMMIFHLGEALGPAFHTQAETYWMELPQDLATVMHDMGVDAAEAWVWEMRTSTRTLGRNGWRTAVLRGVMADVAARTYVETEAAKLSPAP